MLTIAMVNSAYGEIDSRKSLRYPKTIVRKTKGRRLTSTMFMPVKKVGQSKNMDNKLWPRIQRNDPYVVAMHNKTR